MFRRQTITAAIASSFVALALAAVPALAGSSGSGQISFSGAAHGSFELASCKFGKTAGYGPAVTLYFTASTPKAGEPTQPQLAIQLNEKHGAAKANLAKTKQYWVEASFFVGSVVDKYEVGAGKTQSGHIYHYGSGSLSIASNLKHGRVSAHAINEYKPHDAKLTVKASWTCS